MSDRILTYRLSTYDPGAGPEEEWGWNVRASGLSLWGLRAALREVWGMGYDNDLSILVERE